MKLCILVMHQSWNINCDLYRVSTVFIEIEPNLFGISNYHVTVMLANKVLKANIKPFKIQFLSILLVFHTVS